MIGIKIDYTCVHTDNYQGGSGMVVKSTMYKVLPNDTMVQMIKEFADNNISYHNDKTGYPIESFHVNKIELIDIKE